MRMLSERALPGPELILPRREPVHLEDVGQGVGILLALEGAGLVCGHRGAEHLFQVSLLALVVAPCIVERVRNRIAAAVCAK